MIKSPSVTTALPNLLSLSGTGAELLANPEVRAAYLEGGH